ncbi:hypothetical protein [Blastomonas sp. UPD001]|jgi:hypothetical protein|uniref:hypothetical protein n=1 Tax=Blastomonas sp. UPD001 TaxID=2217673 RepID=UPI000E34C623|nr:hypothetical protein [Blastomonas sp. UPD001]MBL0965649.1 hypothetical protein [Blastomonas sp.]
MTDWQEEVSDTLAQVARNLVRKHGQQNRGILLLCSHEIGVGYDVFVGRDDRIECSAIDLIDHENVDLLLDLDHVPPMSKRWAAFALFVQNGTLSTNFVYDEDIAPDGHAFDDRDVVIASYFGNGPIVYPENRYPTPRLAPARQGGPKILLKGKLLSGGRLRRPRPASADEERKAWLIADLASTLRAETSFSPLGTLMIAVVESGYISIARFWDRGSYIACGHPDYDKYRDTLFELWAMEPLSRRWDEIHYLIRGTDVRITYLYPEDIEPDISEFGRWRDASQAAFGAKKVVYPHGHGSAQILLR